MESLLIVRTVVQRSRFAEVIIENQSQGKMERGLVLLFGVGFSSDVEGWKIKKENIENQDSTLVIKSILPKLEKFADKILSLRIFTDLEEKMNLSLKDISGGLYVVSQFTLFADCKKGNRPGFSSALKPTIAKLIYEKFIEIIQIKYRKEQIFTGQFGADMQVIFCNDGPVTIILEDDLL